MTQDEIIRMAQEAGLQETFYIMEELERFAALVAEATKEKAAKVCDGFERKKWEILAKGGVAAGLSPADCAAAIRSMK